MSSTIAFAGAKFAQQRLRVQNSHDIVGIRPIKREASVRTVEDDLKNLFGRQVRVEHRHVPAMGHDLADFDIVQLQDAVQHLPFVTDFRLGSRVECDGAAQFFLTLGPISQLLELDPERTQRRIDNDVNRMRNGRENEHEDPDHGRDQQRRAIRLCERDRLRHNLSENQHKKRHDDRRIDDSRIAEDQQKRCRRQGGRQNIDHIIAEQNGANQAFALFVEREDQFGATVSLPRKFIRGSEARVNAVSEPEKKADRMSSTKIAPASIK